MSDLAALIDSISRRVRDASNTAHSRALIQDTITRCASAINTRQEYILDNVTLTVATAHKALYRVEAELGSLSRITEVAVYDDALEEVDPWRDLWKHSPTWLTDTSDVPLAWAAIGRDLIGIWPAPVSNIPVTFTGVRGTFQATLETEETGLREEDDDIVKELTQALILLRQRDLDLIQSAISRMAGKMNIQISELEYAMRLG